MIIRSQGALLIRLFMMMLSAGIPQLTNVSDVDYLKDTLALDLTEEEARKKFIDKLKEAKNKSWSTSVNWALHNMAHWDQKHWQNGRLKPQCICNVALLCLLLILKSNLMECSQQNEI